MECFSQREAHISVKSGKDARPTATSGLQPLSTLTQRYNKKADELEFIKWSNYWHKSIHKQASMIKPFGAKNILTKDQLTDTREDQFGYALYTLLLYY